MKDKRIDATHIEVIFDKDDILKYELGRFIGTSRDNQAKPKIMAGPFERAAAIELKDKYKGVILKYTDSVDCTPEGDVNLILEVNDDTRQKSINKHPDTLVYTLNDKKDKNKKEEDIMSDVLFVNSKRAHVTVKKDEFDGSEAAVEKLAKAIGQYGNVADYGISSSDKFAIVEFILDKECYKFAGEEKSAGFESDRSVAIEIAEMFINGNISDAARYCDENGGTKMKHLVYDVLKENYGEEAADSFRRNIYASSTSIEKVSTICENILIEKVASGAISADDAKEVYAELLRDVYADGRLTGVQDIDDTEYNYRLHILNDILPTEAHAHSQITKYMFEHDTGDMIKDVCNALFNYAVEHPQEQEVIKECVGKLLMDKEIRNNDDVKNIADYLQISLPSDTATLEVYADNDKGITNPEVATGDHDLICVVKLEGSNEVYSAVDFDGNSAFVKAIMQGLDGKSGSIEELSAIISSIVPGSKIQQGNGRDQYSFEDGVGSHEEDSFQNLIDEAFDDTDEIGNTGISTLDEKSRSAAIKLFDEAMTKFADMLETTSLTGNAGTIPTDGSNSNTVNKDGKVYTPNVDQMTGEPTVDEEGKVTYTAEDGDVQKWTQQEVSEFANNTTIDPSQAVSTSQF